MDSGERAFVIARWIAIIGLSPIIYLFFAGQIIMFIGILTSNLHNDYLIIIVYILAVIGFFIFLYFVIKREQKKNHVPMKQVNDKFLVGVFLIFIGDLGLGAFYSLIIFSGSGVGSAIILIAIPIIILMIIFYLIGFSIVNKEKLLDKLRESNELYSHT